MSEQNGTNLTQEYEEKALKAFRLCYQQKCPTLDETSTQVAIIVRDVVKELTLFRVVRLLAEHPDWCRASVALESNEERISISKVARRLLVSHLTHVIENEGLQIGPR